MCYPLAIADVRKKSSNGKPLQDANGKTIKFDAKHFQARFARMEQSLAHHHAQATLDAGKPTSFKLKFLNKNANPWAYLWRTVNGADKVAFANNEVRKRLYCMIIFVAANPSVLLQELVHFCRISCIRCFSCKRWQDLYTTTHI